MAHPIYSCVVMRALVRDLIALRQMSLRRFISVMRLVDEEFYEPFLEILSHKSHLPLEDTVATLRESIILFMKSYWRVKPKIWYVTSKSSKDSLAK